MAYLHRLIFCALLALASWLPTSSYAYAPTYGAWAPTAPSAAACAPSLGSGWSFVSISYAQPSPTNQTAQCQENCTSDLAHCGSYLNDGKLYNYGGPFGRSVACLPGDTFNGTECTVNTNYCTTLTGKFAGDYSGPGGTGAHTLCDTGAHSGDSALPGCLISGTANIAYGDSPNQTWSAAMSYTGAKCVPSGDAPNAPSPTGCPVGQMQGTVNGNVVCYKPGPETSKSSQGAGSTTTTNSDGSKTKTDTKQTTTCTGAGSCSTTTEVTVTGTTSGGTTGTPVTTSTTTTCTRGSPGCQTTATTQTPVTTTSTSTGSTSTGTPVTSGGTTTTPTGSNTTTTTSSTGGAATGSGGGSGGNGNGNGGGDGGMFSGACGAPPICDGDAVMCAVAAATFTTNCTLSDPKLPTPLYDAAITKTGDQTTALSGNSTVSVASSQFDQTELLGAGSGMTDRIVTVAHQSISIPFSSVNIWLQRLGVVLQAVAFLVAARIVIRG